MSNFCEKFQVSISKKKMHFLKFVGLGPSAKSRALNCKNKGIAKSANISATNRPTDQPTDHVAWWSVGLSVGQYMVGHKKKYCEAIPRFNRQARRSLIYNEIKLGFCFVFIWLHALRN